jgi:secreted trypsin-like serine protease
MLVIFLKLRCYLKRHNGFSRLITVIFVVTPSREQLLELPIVPLDQCTKVYSQVIPVTQNQICVGGEARKDACSGFGGAPLILLDHYTRSTYYQV